MALEFVVDDSEDNNEENAAKGNTKRDENYQSSREMFLCKHIR
jgi:hypothetical protein